MALVAVALVGSAGAAPTTDTTAVAFVDIPAKQIWGNNSVNPGKFESVVVIGGTTTVPTNATTVRLEVTVKGAADGTLKFYPAGNEAGGAGHTLSWTAGSTNTTVTKENVGQQNKVSVFNTSTKAAVVTIKVTGYSTQVTAGDINGSGGTAGQVLTNNGTGGVVWGDIPVRVAQASTKNLFSPTSELIQSVTINAPRQGFVLVHGSAVAYNSGASCPCQAYAAINHLGGGKSNDHSASLMPGSFFNSVAVTWIFPVQQGSNTFELRVGEFPGNSLHFYNPQVQAAFIPSDGSGGLAAARAASAATTKPGPAGTQMAR